MNITWLEALTTLIEGLIAFISPCVLPMIPVYVLYFAGSSEGRQARRTLLRALSFVLGFTVLFVLLRFSKWGLSVRATASNEYVAGMLGINTYVITAISWGLAGALGTLAATMNGGINQVGPYFMTSYQVNAFLAGILGGFSTFYGPVVAAFLLPLANNLVVYLANVIGKPELSSWSLVIVYGLALVLIFFKPEGLFGKRTVKKV